MNARFLGGSLREPLCLPPDPLLLISCSIRPVLPTLYARIGTSSSSTRKAAAPLSIGASECGCREGREGVEITRKMRGITGSGWTEGSNSNPDLSASTWWELSRGGRKEACRTSFSPLEIGCTYFDLSLDLGTEIVEG